MQYYNDGMSPEGMPPIDPKDRLLYLAITLAALVIMAITGLCTSHC